MADSDDDISFESADENEIKEINDKNQPEDIEPKCYKNIWNWDTLTQLGSNVLNKSSKVLNHASSSMGTFTSSMGESLVLALDSMQSGFVRHQDSTENFDDNSEQLKDSTESKTAYEVDESGLNESQVQGDGWLSSLSLGSFTTMVNSASSVVHQTTQSVGNSGIKMMNTGLDVLETIGKKTYDAVIESDLGIKEAIQKNKNCKPNLSEILRNARNEADVTDKETQDLLNVSYSYWFDSFNGIAYLEALETLSSVSKQQLNSFLENIPKDVIDSIKIELGRIKKIFEDSELKEDDEKIKNNFNEDLDKYSFDSTIPVTISKLLKSHDEFISWMYKYQNIETVQNSQMIYIEAIKQLALFTALSIEHLNRISSVLTRDQSPVSNDGEFVKTGFKEYNYVEVAHVMTRLVLILDHEIKDRATQFSSCLSKIDELDNSKELITSIYLESVNSCSYIYKSLNLCMPILQLAAIKQHNQ